MRQVNDLVLNGSDVGNVNGSQLDTNQMINISFHCVRSDATGAGSFKVQVSNDVAPLGISGASFVVTNWVDLPNASVTMPAATLQGIIPLVNVAYRWMRVVYTETTPGIGTVKVFRFGTSA